MRETTEPKCDTVPFRSLHHLQNNNNNNNNNNNDNINHHHPNVRNNPQQAIKIFSTASSSPSSFSSYSFTRIYRKFVSRLRRSIIVIGDEDGDGKILTLSDNENVEEEEEAEAEKEAEAKAKSLCSTERPPKTANLARSDSEKYYYRDDTEQTPRNVSDRYGNEKNNFCTISTCLFVLGFATLLLLILLLLSVKNATFTSQFVRIYSGDEECAPYVTAEDLDLSRHNYTIDELLYRVLRDASQSPTLRLATRAEWYAAKARFAPSTNLTFDDNDDTFDRHVYDINQRHDHDHDHDDRRDDDSDDDGGGLGANVEAENGDKSSVMIAGEANNNIDESRDVDASRDADDDANADSDADHVPLRRCSHYSCFDIYRCGLPNFNPFDSPKHLNAATRERIKIYVYPALRFVLDSPPPPPQNRRNTTTTATLDSALIEAKYFVSSQFTRILATIVRSAHFTANPREACLFIVNIDMLDFDRITSARTLERTLWSLPFFAQTGGSNHLLFTMNIPQIERHDSHFGIEIGEAMIAGAGFDVDHYRRNFDISLPVYSVFSELMLDTEAAAAAEESEDFASSFDSDAHRHHNNHQQQQRRHHEHRHREAIIARKRSTLLLVTQMDLLETPIGDALRRLQLSADHEIENNNNNNNNNNDNNNNNNRLLRLLGTDCDRFIARNDNSSSFSPKSSGSVRNLFVRGKARTESMRRYRDTFVCEYANTPNRLHDNSSSPSSSSKSPIFDNRLIGRYLDALHDAHFCLIARTSPLATPLLSDALMSGCIPVIISDTYVLPFDERIDWPAAAIRIRSAAIERLLEIVRSVPPERRIRMRASGLHVWRRYFASIETMTRTAIEIVNDRVYPRPRAANSIGVAVNRNDIIIRKSDNPVIGSSSTISVRDLIPLTHAYYAAGYTVFAPKQAHLHPSAAGFTAVILSYNRVQSLFEVINMVAPVPSCAKIVVVWNSQTLSPPASHLWPTITTVPIQVILTDENRLSNRFFPYASIETDAIFAIDDDITMLNSDEIEFAYQTWREFPDRIVGFPSRLHLYDNRSHHWSYDSEWKNQFSMILTGAAFYHNYYNHLYTYVMPAAIRDWVDRNMNCEDIAMNFMVSNFTRSAPIKVTPRKKFKCPECARNHKLSTVALQHLRTRSKCIEYFVSIYQMLPLKAVEFRSNPVLFRDNIPDKLKHYNSVGTL